MTDIEGWIHKAFDGAMEYGRTDLRVDCPFCENRVGAADSGYHLHISLVKQACHCFRCDYAASWARLVMDVDGIPFGQAMDTLNRQGVPLYKLVAQSRFLKQSALRQGMPKDFLTIVQGSSTSRCYWTHCIAEMAARYVERRLRDRVDSYAKYMNTWGIWKDKRGWGKLVFPVERGWWQERRILRDFSGPKYISCKHPKEGRVYNWQALGRYDHIYIAEGIISATCIGTNAIALCGKQATPEQINRLGCVKVTKYTICLDADALGESMRLANELHRRGKEVRLRIYDSGDPASALPENHKELPYNWAAHVKAQLQ